MGNKDVLNADEAGVKIDSELAWVHVPCTPTLTFMVSQKKKSKRFREIIKLSNIDCPISLPEKGSGKKKVKQAKERNLLSRLDDYEDQGLLFMKNKSVPFINNQAERDIRMLKVHQKVSGQFKTLETAKHFSRIRRCLMTAKKRGISPYDKLNLVFTPKDAE